MKTLDTAINHIFIFCDNHDEVVQELLDFGFIEGSNRVHPNQGTRNRKFYFSNFYLEILWVHNQDEVTSTLTSPTKLYERSLYSSNGYSPFGICLTERREDDIFFQNSLVYKPSYLPESMVIEVITNDDTPSLPWTFRWKTDSIFTDKSEYVGHDNGITKLTKVSFKLPKVENTIPYIEHFMDDETLDFEDGKCISLKLEFDNGGAKRKKVFETLPLLIEY